MLMTLSLSKTLTFYKRADIREELVRQAAGKEVAFRFGEFFGKRPEVLTYPEDVLELAKHKVTSFHCSEELWTNPLQISTSMKKDELAQLRRGWDLILDIDCKIFEYSRMAANLVVKALKENDVKSVTVKFSGNKGFHIAVPFEAFPKTFGGKNTADLFPEAPRKIALYITETIRRALSREILAFEKGDFSRVMQKTGLDEKKIKMYERNKLGDLVPALNVDPFLEIDTILITSRHLYRMPYSFHESSGLVSVPIDPDRVLEFEKPMAAPELVKVDHPFLDRSAKVPDAGLLLRNAYDFSSIDVSPVRVEEEKRERRFKPSDLPDDAPAVFIGEEHFPPCMKLIALGIEDGKKRAVFAMIKFLAGCGWTYDQIEEYLRKWNEKNREPLREVYYLGQLRYAREQDKGADMPPPPNCNNLNYYVGIGVCRPDALCQKIKNPLQYAKRHHKISTINNKPKRAKKTRANPEEKSE